MFLTATLEWAMIQTGQSCKSQMREVAAMVVVFPVPGGPVSGDVVVRDRLAIRDDYMHHER